ncbi:MAG: acyltransferase family protein [Anaerolineae bacterium]
MPIIPLLIVQLALRLFFYEGEHNWADFFFLMVFFIFGYLLYSDERFTQAIRRDWWLILLVAITAAVLIIAALVCFDAYNWVSMPWHPGFYIAWTLVVINAWCWTLLMLAVGIRFLNFSNKWLNYAQEATLPFFLFHQPVIMILSYFVVQWDAAILPKLLTILTGTLVLTLGLYILLIRRIKVLRLIFGVKPMRVQSRAAPST